MFPRGMSSARPLRSALLVGLFLVILVVTVTSGCSLFRIFHKPSPGSDSSAPNRSGPISGVPTREPAVSVYFVDTGEKRTMPIEGYLAGVVAAEMEPSWPLEALAAQAIVARTYTLDRMAEGGARKAHGTDVSTSFEEFQAYDARKINDNVRRAIQITRGQVLTYHGKLAEVWFHDASGGITATPLEGLNYKEKEVPYIKPVMDAKAPEVLRPWKATISGSELAAAAFALSGGKNPWPLDRVEIAARGPSGRAISIRVGQAVVSAAELRLALGSERMRSTLLDSLTYSGGTVVMQGRGWGHGVGLSQQGAKVLAGQGKKAGQIIAVYFKDLTLTQQWR